MTLRLLTSEEDGRDDITGSDTISGRDSTDVVRAQDRPGLMAGTLLSQ